MSESQNLFDLGEHYVSMLRAGIQLSGEDERYFIRGRLDDLKRQLPADFRPLRILDFGCGIGLASAYLSTLYPESDVLGVDTAANAIEYARQRSPSSRLRFALLNELDTNKCFDLCYCNGVFHHIAPAERPGAASLVLRSLSPGGYFALFENNPLNPGTRMVMKRIPFDADAITLYPWETTRLLQEAGFQKVSRSRFLFYFPRPLAALRFLEPALVNIPLGAQYCTLGFKAVL